MARGDRVPPVRETPIPWEKTFVDLFSGCGGLSLGLMQAGWRGLFAIEANEDAFRTLSHNLVDTAPHNGSLSKMRWPGWLAKAPHEITRFIRRHSEDLKHLRGRVHLLAGGPPCQGFSFAGRRDVRDSRNNLFVAQMKIVKMLSPAMVLLENVPGIQATFRQERRNFGDRICKTLEGCGYHVRHDIVLAAEFGVPQLRPRWFVVGFRRDMFTSEECPNFFRDLRKFRKEYLTRLGLPAGRYVTVREAISDLKTKSHRLVDCHDVESRSGFKEIRYKSPKSAYQKMMHGEMNGHAMNSLRLPNHRADTMERFSEILSTCRKGFPLSVEDRERLGMRKLSVTPLSPDFPSPTITTLPDDLIHYEEPRVHTVREHARLQSFPDWFEFRGKYTTGGLRRRWECPRYTQVGNAVPPLLARALGEMLGEYSSSGARVRSCVSG